MENNTTISLEERRDILLSNPHARLWVTRYKPREYAALEMYPEIIDDYNDYDGKNLHCYQQLVKPLSKISDEDAIAVSEMMGYKVNLVGGGKKITERMLRDWNTWARVTGNVIDHLRSRGYALPYGNWSVKELVEFGIFKLVE